MTKTLFLLDFFQFTIRKGITHLVANCSKKIQQILLNLIITQMPILELDGTKSYKKV